MRATIFALVSLALLPACKRKSHESFDLRTRIVNAKTSQYCHLPDACFNPIILVLDHGYDITTFAGDRPEHVGLRTERLRGHLLSLPMNAWPRGPTIVITPSDDVTDAPSLQTNLEEAREVCRSLHLEVEFRPGG